MRWSAHELLQYDYGTLDFHPFDFCVGLGCGISHGSFKGPVMTFASLRFCPQADALMAGLASRAHQWKFWDMIQVERYEIEWGEKRPVRVFQASGRTELRIYQPLTPTSVSASVSPHVSASHILTTLLVEGRSLGRLRHLENSPIPSLEGVPLPIGPHLLKLQTLDQIDTCMDPWQLPLGEWLKIFSARPTQIEDIKYRNSSGFLAHCVSQTIP